MNRSRNNIFSDPFTNLTRSKAQEIVEEIESQPDEYFESVPIEEFAEYLVAKFTIDDFPTLIWEEIQMEFSETEVAGRDLPRTFDVSDPSKRFKMKVVEYHVPIEGNSGFLRFRQSNIISTAVTYGTLSINGNILCFSFTDVYNDPSKVESAFNTSKNTVNGKISGVKKEFDAYNRDLRGFIQVEINKRVQKINHTNDYKSKFKYPIKKKNVPTAFESPRIVKKKKITPKPVGLTNGANKQRFISDEDYMHILGLLQDFGKNWEHHPEIYKGKGEEALRDQLIFVLAPNIEGVVAGEAYNKKGKTDIAIKHESTNLFIGECKIWKGPQVFTKTIDQILGYLTWRDSKAAIMMFVPNQEISAVKSAADETAKSHSNFVRVLEVINEGWVNYRFHLENDPGTYLSLAVQLYHLPELKTEHTTMAKKS
jgi:hypothetical protein